MGAHPSHQWCFTHPSSPPPKGASLLVLPCSHGPLQLQPFLVGHSLVSPRSGSLKDFPASLGALLVLEYYTRFPLLFPMVSWCLHNGDRSYHSITQNNPNLDSDRVLHKIITNTPKTCTKPTLSAQNESINTIQDSQHHSVYKTVHYQPANASFMPTGNKKTITVKVFSLGRTI